MLLPDPITTKYLAVASSFLTSTRLQKVPKLSFGKDSPFRALDQMALFLDTALMKARENEILSSKVKNFYRWLSVTRSFDLELNAALLDSRATKKNKAAKDSMVAINLKTFSFYVQKQLQLKKSINGYSKLFLRIELVPYFEKKVVHLLSVSKIEKLSIDQIYYRCQISAGLSDKNDEFLHSDMLIFSDARDIQFHELYNAVEKRWTKKLRAK